MKKLNQYKNNVQMQIDKTENVTDSTRLMINWQISGKGNKYNEF